MKTFYFVLLALLMQAILPARAALIFPSPSDNNKNSLSILQPKPPEKKMGKWSLQTKKLLYRFILKKYNRVLAAGGEITEKQKKLARWSLILGIGAFAIALIPYVGILSIPAAIASFILGIKSIKGNSNTSGIIGLVLSATFIFILLLAIAIIAFTPVFIF